MTQHHILYTFKVLSNIVGIAATLRTTEGEGGINFTWISTSSDAAAAALGRAMAPEGVGLENAASASEFRTKTRAELAVI